MNERTRKAIIAAAEASPRLSFPELGERFGVATSAAGHVVRRHREIEARHRVRFIAPVRFIAAGEADARTVNAKAAELVKLAAVAAMKGRRLKAHPVRVQVRVLRPRVRREGLPPLADEAELREVVIPELVGTVLESGNQVREFRSGVHLSMESGGVEVVVERGRE